MKRRIVVIIIICCVIVATLIIYNKVNNELTVQVTRDIEQFNWSEIINKISSNNTGEIYFISHWSDPFSIDVNKNLTLRKMTLSLAVQDIDNGYDIYQIRVGKQQNEMRYSKVEKRNNYMELNTPFSANKFIKFLENFKWSKMIEVLPEAEYYTFKYWGLFEKGEMISKESPVYHGFSAQKLYTIDTKGNVVNIDIENGLVAKNDMVLVAIAVMNKSDNGYKGNADVGLLVELY